MLDRVLNIKETDGQAVITLANSPMTIAVYQLAKEEFDPAPADEVYYADGAEPLAFVVNERDPDQADIIPIAIQWFGVMHLQRKLDIGLIRPVCLRLVK